MKPVVLVLLFCFLQVQATNEWEDLFLSIPSPSRAYEHLAYYTSLPHVAGSSEDYETATYTLAKFLQYGLSAKLDTHDVLLSTPISRKVKLLSPELYDCKLQEKYYPEDPTSGDSRIIPTFNGYSPSGNVTAQLVYVNYGTVQDYEELEKLSVSVKGKIVIVRYGHVFRGVKAMLAQLHGAIGCIIYSDPADDGYVQGEVYPNGPYRPESGVQRGSVQFLSLCPGDPRNPLCISQIGQNYTSFIPSIPVQPISWGDAQHLLRSLSGPVVTNWQGGLPFTYHVGPGPAVVNLDLNIQFSVSPIWNVIATIPGSSSETVVIGNHRDAWVFGAVDPNSGTAGLLEVARGFSELLKKGWVPKRNIVLASWDGEEYGLLGSTSYADSEGDFLSNNVVAYINVDVGVCGPNFSVSATHSLDRFIRSVASDIIDPNSGKPLSSVWNGEISDLGSGSDYTSFIHHYGVASLDFSFQSDDYGVYHSTYDSMYWMKNFGDPTFVYYKTLSQYFGLLTMRIADANVLPFNYTDSVFVFEKYYKTVSELLIRHGGEGKVSLSSLAGSIATFKKAALSVEGESIKSGTNLQDLNTRLYKTERQFLSSKGLPQRPYYRHLLQAPGIYLGYGSTSLPGVSEAIVAQDWVTAQSQVQLLAKHFIQAAQYLSGGN